MFGKTKTDKPQQLGKTPTAAPPMAEADITAMRAWFERYGHHYVERNRYAVIAAILAGVCVTQSLALWQLTPLKTVEPWVVTVNEATGAPDAQRAAAQHYAPGEKEIQYFLARFVSLMWEIDRYKSKENLIQAAGMTIDEGAGKLNGWINENNIFGRLKENDSLTRTVAINSVTQLDKGAAIVRISTVERGLNVPEKRAKWLITLHFKLIPPETAADILKNPLGIYIHNMTIQEDLG